MLRPLRPLTRIEHPARVDLALEAIKERLRARGRVPLAGGVELMGSHASPQRALLGR